MTAPNRDLPAGTIIDSRYRVLGRIGAGGMATVYRARHLGMQRDVALKVLDATTAPGNLAKRFEREARAIARLDHPGCVRVFDYGRSIGRQYLAMELLEGPTLARELDVRKRLPPLLVAQTAQQILDALAHAHAQGILHRDVKPSNVMFGRRGAGRRLVLIDFGLARLSDEAPLTAAGLCAGSPSYIAPERLAGAPYDARADVYATGVVLYEMLAGRRPFEGERAKDIAKKSLHEDPPLLAKLAPRTPPVLAAIVMRALAKDPAQRYPDAQSMLAAIEALPKLSIHPPVPRAARSRDETTLLEIDVRSESRWRRALSWLFGHPRERTAEITSAG
jgi:serine/threonine-protein kinase